MSTMDATGGGTSRIEVLLQLISGLGPPFGDAPEELTRELVSLLGGGTGNRVDECAAVNLRVRGLFLQARVNEALELFESALRRFPNELQHQGAWSEFTLQAEHLLGHLWFESVARDDMGRAYRRLIGLAGVSPVVHLNAVRYYRKTGDFFRAVRLCERIHRVAPNLLGLDTEIEALATESDDPTIQQLLLTKRNGGPSFRALDVGTRQSISDDRSGADAVHRVMHAARLGEGLADLDGLMFHRRYPEVLALAERILARSDLAAEQRDPFLLRKGCALDLSGKSIEAFEILSQLRRRRAMAEVVKAFEVCHSKLLGRARSLWTGNPLSPELEFLDDLLARAHYSPAFLRISASRIRLCRRLAEIREFEFRMLGALPDPRVAHEETDRMRQEAIEEPKRLLEDQLLLSGNDPEVLGAGILLANDAGDAELRLRLLERVRFQFSQKPFSPGLARILAEHGG